MQVDSKSIVALDKWLQRSLHAYRYEVFANEAIRRNRQPQEAIVIVAERFKSHVFVGHLERRRQGLVRCPPCDMMQTIIASRARNDIWHLTIANCTSESLVVHFVR